MVFPEAFFELNWRFAQKVAEVSDREVEDVLLAYTNLYERLRPGQDLDPADPVWRTFVDGLRRASDPVAWMYRFYLARRDPEAEAAGEPGIAFGCFVYTVWSRGKIRIHFQNRETSASGPLSRTRIEVRTGELRAMFAHIRANVEAPRTVAGGSWLYNLEAYRRLFPPAYLATAQEGEREFPFLALWGQFLNRHGRVRPEAAGRFLACLARQRDLQGAAACFPFQVLRLEHAIETFYAFYGV